MRSDPDEAHVGMLVTVTTAFKRHLELYAGMRRYAREHTNWKVTLDPPECWHVYRRGRPMPFDGLVGRLSKGAGRAARRLGVPAIHAASNADAPGLPQVAPDLVAAGRLVSEHLIARGHQRFAFLAWRREPADVEKLAGYRAVIKEAALAGPRCLITGFPIWPPTREMQSHLEKWMRQTRPPFALMTTYDDMAHIAASACAHMGLRVPEDVAIVSCGNEELLCESSEPPLSSVDHDFESVGFRAAQALHEWLRGRSPQDRRELLPPSHLAVRRSSDTTVVDDVLVANAISFMSRRFRDGVSVNDVAGAMQVSRRVLERRFRQALGQSVLHEINRHRIEHARRLLAETTLPLERIAELAGISGARQLCRLFAQYLRTTPGACREQA